MKNAQKKIAAALAAIELYLEDEAAALVAQEDPGLAPAIVPLAPPALWSQSANLETMAARRMLQLRAFSRLR